MTYFLDRVIGQKKAVEILSRLVNSQNIPNALLFAGSPGVGKHFTAIQFIKDINGSEGINSLIRKSISNISEPYIKYIIPLPRAKGEDNDNSATRKLDENTINSIAAEIKNKSENPYYYFDIDGANIIKLSSIREIRKFLSLSFERINYRTILIDKSELMGEEAQNALLKNLEEPPPGVLFILLSNNPDKLLPTIRSRCQRIDFNPLKEKDIRDIIKNYYNYDELEYELPIKFANGSVKKAIELTKTDFIDFLDKTIDIIRHSLAGNYNTALNKFNEMQENSGKEILYEIIDSILFWLSDVQHHRNFGEPNYFTNYKDTFEKFNRRFEERDIYPLMTKLNSYKSLIDANINLNLIVLNIIFEIRQLGSDYV